MGREHHPLQRLLDRFDGRCGLCDQLCLLQETTRDHVIPKCMGGAMSSWNLRPAHRSCNADRARQFPSGAFRGISEDVQRVVWEREGGCCVGCGSSQFLIFHRKAPGSGPIRADLVRLMCVDCARHVRRRRNHKTVQKRQAAR